MSTETSSIRFRAGTRTGSARVTIRPDGRSNHAAITVTWNDGSTERRDVFGVTSPEHAIRLTFDKLPIEILDE